MIKIRENKDTVKIMKIIPNQEYRVQVVIKIMQKAKYIT